MEKEVAIGEDGESLMAHVSIPEAVRGVIVCAHANGNGRTLSRNKFVSKALNHAGYATVVVDLLTEDEASERANVFDIELLAARIEQVARWTSAHPRLRTLPLALKGCSTAAAAVLKAASSLGDQIQAVVSQAGRADLATECLTGVHAPTLFIVGSEDHPVVEMNEWASKQMKAHHELKVIEGADHLFDEAGALEEVATVTRQWLDQEMAAHPAWKTAYMRLQQQYII